MDKAKRFNYLINPQFQLKLIGFLISVVLLTCGILYISNLYFIWRFIELGRELQLPDQHAFFKFITELRRSMTAIFLFTTVIITIISALGGLIISHRAAGAMFRLESHMDSVGESGELREVNFRKNDFFSEIAEAFNRMLDGLKGKKK